MPAPLAAHPVLSTLGPEPLSPAFDAAALARACKGKKTPLKVALLDQRVVAGLGNIYAAEALYLARLSPERQASTIATPSGAPREAARRLAAAIKQVLTEAIDRTVTGRVSIGEIPRLRPRRRTLPARTMRRDDRAADAGRPVDVLLSPLPALAPALDFASALWYVPARPNRLRRPGTSVTEVVRGKGVEG